MKKNLIILSLSILVIINLLLNVLDQTSNKKIAYVRSQELVYGYTGMKEMQLKYQDQSKIWESNIDTLKIEYQRALSDYQLQIDKLSLKERETRENLLYAQKNNLIQYSENVQSQSKEQEQKMIESVLNQVNSYVEEYGEKKGYDLILGTTLSGNILYGNEVIDITDELIKEINNKYEGK